MSKRQKMSKKAIAHLDTLMINLKQASGAAEMEVEEESKEGGIMRDIEKYKKAVKRKEEKHNAVAYKIDS